MRTDGNTIVVFLVGLYHITCDCNDSLTCVMPALLQLWPVQDV